MRVLDTALAAQLGMAIPRHIRVLIKKNTWELEGYGGVVQRDTLASGNKTTAFYLNKQQALLICILSKTPRAREVRAEVIRRFDAYEAPPAQPQTAPGMDQLMGAMTALMQTMQGFVQVVAAKAPELRSSTL
ncbi:hypothetical protein [Methylobacterium sp. WL9]|uniref:hypothetical protein n=1 Tax=Methylobacterium sp. WL9 TaxID=2603898 RepID=UPI0011C7D825|nr:hypothetical protein [Methylobacterium sp. WL9]TXN20782.1 hypothetical protein FV217_16770 [Methylobacterium sp. WL9]